MPKLATQLLSPIVSRFLSDWITRFSSDPEDPPMSELQLMMRRDPVSGLCVQLVNLYILAAIAPYTHPSKRIQKQVRNAIAQCKGSWKSQQEEFLSFIPFGRSFSEIAHDTDLPKAVFKEIRTLDPLHYFFEGTRKAIEKVTYVGLTNVNIDYSSGIHLVNEPHLCFGDPLGIPAASRAYPYWKLHQILMPIMSVAAQRQATPILIYRTETEATIELLDANGNPLINPQTGETITITKGEDAKKAIEALSSSGALVIDTNEEVKEISQDVAADFLMMVLKLCEQYRMMSFLVPSTIASFSTSGIGDAGLATSQREVFEAICASRAQYLVDQIIEQMIKPLIIYNFGEQEDYGTFPVSFKDPTALAIAELITQAFQRGAFTTEDEQAVIRLRELLGVQQEELTYSPA